jgi:hypothetical protein
MRIALYARVSKRDTENQLAPEVLSIPATAREAVISSLRDRISEHGISEHGISEHGLCYVLPSSLVEITSH